MFVVRVICEFDVAEAVPFSELRVSVWSPDTKMRGLVLVTVLWPSDVTYVYSEPTKSLTAMVVLIVERSEFVNSNAVDSGLSVVEGEEEASEAVSVDEPVAEAVVDMSVPVPVSSCALTPSAARHNSHTGLDNMMASMSSLFRALQKDNNRQYKSKHSEEQAKLRQPLVEIMWNAGGWIRSTETTPSQTGRLVMNGFPPRRRAASPQPFEALFPRPVLVA